MKSNPSLSVAIISRNEEARIAHCLESVRPIADEIVIVDSGSTDNTVAIAESMGARVYSEEWKGFVGQRNSVLDKCSCDWVLFIDCDEVLSEETRNNILQAIGSSGFDGYKLKYISQFMGKWVKHSWRQDWHLRLVLRSMGRWTGQYVHETLECDGNIGRIEGLVYHFTYKDYEQILTKGVFYATLSAQSLCARNKKIQISHLILNPLWGFLKHFIFKLGFLDGFQGFVIAVTNMNQTFNKYLLAWEMQHPELSDKPSSDKSRP